MCQTDGITIDLGGGTDKVGVNDSFDITGISMNNVDTFAIDLDNNNTSGTTTITTNQATMEGLVGAASPITAISVGSSTNSAQLTSDDGLALQGVAVFSGSSGFKTHSLVLDSGNDTAGALLNVDQNTVFGSSGNTIEIKPNSDGTGTANDIIASNDGIDFTAGGRVKLVNMGTINFNADSSGNDSLTIDLSLIHI